MRPLVIKNWQPRTFGGERLSAAAHVCFGKISKMKQLGVLTHCPGEGTEDSWPSSKGLVGQGSHRGEHTVGTQQRVGPSREAGQAPGC